jgi:Bacterial extracellular solute-binding proteins, family 3
VIYYDEDDNWVGNFLKSQSRMNPKTLWLKTVLIFVFWSSYQSILIAEDEFPPPQIVIGVRTSVPIIGEKFVIDGDDFYRGFCKDFSDKLRSNIYAKYKKDVEILFKDIKYIYDENKPRFQGLRNHIVSIDCGPNSKPLQQDSDDKTWEGILFSKVFHKTNVRLLMKKETYNKLLEKLSKVEKENSFKEIEKLHIAVMKNTTTRQQLEQSKYIGQKSKNEYSTRKLALDALYTGEMEAYASDALILQTVRRFDVKSRFTEYIIFPSNSDEILPNLKQEEYAIAVLEGDTHTGELLANINDALDELSDDHRLTEAENKIKDENDTLLGNRFPVIQNKMFFALGLIAAIGAIILLLKVPTVNAGATMWLRHFSNSIPNIWLKRTLRFLAHGFGIALPLE